MCVDLLFESKIKKRKKNIFLAGRAQTHPMPVFCLLPGHQQSCQGLGIFRNKSASFNSQFEHTVTLSVVY